MIAKFELGRLSIVRAGLNSNLYPPLVHHCLYYVCLQTKTTYLEFQAHSEFITPSKITLKVIKWQKLNPLSLQSYIWCSTYLIIGMISISYAKVFINISIAYGRYIGINDLAIGKGEKLSKSKLLLPNFSS